MTPRWTISKGERTTQCPVGIYESGQGLGKAWVSEKPASFRQRNHLEFGMLPAYSVCSVSCALRLWPGPGSGMASVLPGVTGRAHQCTLTKIQQATIVTPGTATPNESQMVAPPRANKSSWESSASLFPLGCIKCIFALLPDTSNAWIASHCTVRV